MKMRGTLLCLFLIIVILVGCDNNNTYQYIEITAEQGALGIEEKEKEPKIIKASSDSSAYLVAFQSFTSSLKVIKDMKEYLNDKVKGNEAYSFGSVYYTPIKFKLLNEKGEDIANTVYFENKDKREKEITEKTFAKVNTFQESIEMRKFVDSLIVSELEKKSIPRILNDPLVIKEIQEAIQNGYDEDETVDIFVPIIYNNYGVYASEIIDVFESGIREIYRDLTGKVDDDVKLFPKNFDQLPTNTHPSSNEVASYKEVTIGKQVWMGENLNVDKFSNGDPISEAKTAEEWAKASENKQPVWCYYDNDPANGAKYGKLYNWYAVNDSRGLGPKGWHIPSEKEWTQLINYLGGESGAGWKMKNITGWDAPDKNNSNSSGFSGLPGGARGISGAFFRIGFNGEWWSSVQGIEKEGSGISIWVAKGGGVYSNNSKNGGVGLSVRCLRD